MLVAIAGSVPALADPVHEARPAGVAGPWSDLGLRTASAVVLLPLAVWCAWSGGPAWLALVILAAGAMLYEWVAMCRAGRQPASVLLSGTAYLALAIASLLWLRADPIMGRNNLMFLLVTVWAGDIGAYLAGRWFGGPRLAPRVSPGKTWSGAAGGIIASALAGACAAPFWPHGAWSAAIALAMLIGAAAQIGDLLESVMKRQCGVKDSGHLIPGHGGLLDRLDGVLLAAPVAAVLGLWLGRGIVLWM